MEQENFDKQEAIFLSLIYSFHAAAMQQLGKLVSPVTGKTERDLNAARGTIDVLRTLEVKTRGNLSERESRTLKNILTELQLNYVDEMNRSAGEGSKAEEAPAASPEEAGPGVQDGEGRVS